MSNPLWFKDAVIYQLHVKTFQDSNGDGIGDFRGLIERIDYFAELGVTALWLLPFYPSPLRDDGYDIADYFNVNPSYGTIEDFKTFLDAAHERGLRVITEVVLNHTSDQNAWFQRSRKAPVGSPERDFYVWSDDPTRYADARIIFKDFEPSNWSYDAVAKSYYWHRFFNHQPDLNFENPLVHEACMEVMDFWLGMGVDGLRLDAIPYLYEREGTNCENLPETHALLKKLRAHIDGKFEDKMLLAEANQWPEDAAAYFGDGDECHMNFHFPLMPRMFMSIQLEDRYPIIDILEQTPALHENCQWAIFLRNHDELTLEMVTDEERDYMYRVYADDPRARINLGIRRRLAPLLGNNRRKMELINSLLFSLPGTPIIYYGDEIGMGDNIYLGDRNGVRTPMQWTPDRNAGFSKANPQKLLLPVIIDPEYHYESVNVENQQKTLSSLFWWTKRMLRERKEWKAFSHGTLEFLQPENAKVLAYIRRYQDETVLVIANLSRFVQVAELDLSAYAGLVPEELFGHSLFPDLKQGPTAFTVGPHGFYWFALRPAVEVRAGEFGWLAPVVEIEPVWGKAVTKLLESDILPEYAPTCRWFGGKGRVMREIRVTENAPIGNAPNAARLILLEVAFTDGLPETYTLPLMFSHGEDAARILAETPQSVVVRFANGSVLNDALYQPEVRQDILRLLTSKTAAGAKVIGHPAAGPLDEVALENALANNRLLNPDQSNTSIAYGDTWFFKFLRKYERGPHPDVEITQHLSEQKQLTVVPTFAGSLALKNAEGEGTIGMMVGFTQNQGDGWVYTLDSLQRYFERVIETRAEFDPALVDDMIGGNYPERARQLGARTAELHAALASDPDLPAFAPEAFSTLYQRSLYQAMRSAAGRVMRQLRRQLPQLSGEALEDSTALLGNTGALFGAYGRLLEHKITALKTRIHGDFHLGQVLNTGKDFVIIDFEGEPRLTLSERRLKHSPLRDVAGMLRSFDYAAAAALRSKLTSDHAAVMPWARGWVEKISATYLDAYLTTATGQKYLPVNPADTMLLLDLFQIHKAVYEIGYELSYRPEMVTIPLRAVQTLLVNSTPTPAFPSESQMAR